MGILVLSHEYTQTRKCAHARWAEKNNQTETRRKQKEVVAKIAVHPRLDQLIYQFFF